MMQDWKHLHGDGHYLEQKQKMNCYMSGLFKSVDAKLTDGGTRTSHNFSAIAYLNVTRSIPFPSQETKT